MEIIEKLLQQSFCSGSQKVGAAEKRRYDTEIDKIMEVLWNDFQGLIKNA